MEFLYTGNMILAIKINLNLLLEIPFCFQVIYNEAACHLKLGNRKNCMYALLEVKKLIDKDTTKVLHTLDIQTPIESVRVCNNTSQQPEIALNLPVL